MYWGYLGTYGHHAGYIKRISPCRLNSPTVIALNKDFNTKPKYDSATY